MRRALLGAALAVVAIPCGASARGAQADTPSARQLTLRLPDLPGYAIERTGPDDTCSALLFADEVPRGIRRLERRVVTEECTVLMEHMWSAPGAPPAPTEVLSVAFTTSAASHAAALLDRPRGTAASVASLRRRAWTLDPAPAQVGDETVLLRARGSAGFGGDGPSVAVLWRSGPVVALVAVTGLRGDTAEQTVLRLAAAQQARIATLTPVLASDYDDSEVGLHDPRLDVPVWWTGREFKGPRLRRVRLLSSVSADSTAHRYGERVTLTYGLNESWTAFEITLIHPSAFERRAVRRDLRSIERDRCVRIERFAAPAGRATLYSKRRHCRTDVIVDPPVAILRRPDVVLVVGCAGCIAVQRRLRPLQHYASRAALRTIVHALRPRAAEGDVAS